MSTRPDYTHPDEDEDEEDEVDESGFKTVRDAVLFAIDVSGSMLRRPSDPDPKRPDTALSPTVAALKCAYALMQQRIISNPNDMMGILLFGTEKTKFQDANSETGHAGLQYPHCYLLTDLDVPAAADVKALRDLVQDDDEAADLLKASDDEVSMANVLFCANQIFTTRAPNFSSRRLFVVTDNDFPHKNNRDARNSAAVRAKDLYDLGVIIELFPISHPDHGFTFDRSKFYNDIVYSNTPSDPDAPAPLTPDVKPATSGDGISLLQALLSSVASRSAPRRALFSSTPFEIGPGLKISVKGYIIFKRQEPKRTSYIYLPPDSDKPQIAAGATTLMSDDIGKAVEKTEIRKAYKFGGETVSFTPEELSKIRYFGDPVIRIIGFKPQAMLPSWASYRPSTFIYPSEEDYVGSSRVFSALHQKLLKDAIMGIAWYIPRRNAVPALVAVIPGAERREPDSGEQTMPPGLWIHPLPFADDIRNPPDTNVVRAPDRVIDAMRTVIQQLHLPKGQYDPHKYPNPSLQWFYKILQALALDEDVPDELEARKEDKTIPRYRQIHKRAGNYVVEWGELLDEAFHQWQRENGDAVKMQTNGAAKRSIMPGSMLQSDGGGGGKKIKQEAGAHDGPTDTDMKKAYEKDVVGKYTVAQLKAFLQARNLAKGLSKKGDLVDAVNRYFETKMDVD